MPSVLAGPIQRRKFYSDLSVGDTYQTTNERGDVVTVEMLRDHEPWADPFGRDFRRFWGRRSDTQAEGWVAYGPGARAVLMVTE